MENYAQAVSDFNTATIVGTREAIEVAAQRVKEEARAFGLANVMLCPSCGEVYARKPANEQCSVCFHHGIIYEPVATFDNRPEYQG